jgi:hypothetical protein
MYKAVAVFSRLLFVALTGLLIHTAQGQSALTFEAKEIDLGYMPEDTGNVVVDFKWSNASDSALWIKEIDTHGGCTIVSYPKDTLAPKAKGKISVRVNPKNRPGPFVRRITLLTLPDSVLHDLYIKSYVEPVVKVWDQNTNETNYGKVALSSDYIRVGHVLENTKLEKSIKIKNTGKETLRFVPSKYKKPTYVTVKGIPDKLLSGQEATVIFTIDFSTSGKLGSYTDMVELYADGNTPKEIIVYLIGKIIPVPVVSATKPTVQLLLNEADLKEIPSDKPAQGSFTLKNTGASPLMIRKVETSCSCLTLDNAAPVAAGESATLYFTFDPRGLSGIEEKKIILYTNAPDQPIITLFVKGLVVSR